MQFVPRTDPITFPDMLHIIPKARLQSPPRPLRLLLVGNLLDKAGLVLKKDKFELYGQTNV